MDKANALEKVKAALIRMRQRIRARRQKIVEEAVELFDLGLDADDVFEEIRDRYIDAVPIWSQKADDLVDFSKILPGIVGEIFEMIDGLMIEHLLRLFVSSAERRHKRGRVPTIGMLRSRDFVTPADLPRRDWAPRQPADEDDEDTEGDDTALNVDPGAAAWGMDGGI